LAEEIRNSERTTVERVNARIKDELGGRTVGVRDHLKVISHLMFGVVASPSIDSCDWPPKCLNLNRIGCIML